jgi:sugar O-acyltransferase (sialic acid O-acetyltransferase NeuD family)
MSAPPVVFYGAGGYAQQVADYVEAWQPEPLGRAVAFIDDFRGDSGLSVGNAPVITFERWRTDFADVPVFVTVADPAARRKLVQRLVAAGGRFISFYRLLPPTARNVVVGDDTFVVAHASVGAGTVVGNHVHVMLLACVDGACTIGDYTTICPQSTVWGPWIIEEGVFIGAGARVVNETDTTMTLGAGAVIAAGAVVTRNVGRGERLYGNPATDLRSLAARNRG